MANRDSIYQALVSLLLVIQGKHIDQIDRQAKTLIQELDRLVHPSSNATTTDQKTLLLCESIGLSALTVRFVRSLVGEATVLATTEEWRAAENAMQRAIDRWNEEQPSSGRRS